MMVDLSDFGRRDWRSTEEKKRIALSPNFHRVIDRRPDDVADQRVHRDPCVRCGVRADHHANRGCRRYWA